MATPNQPRDSDIDGSYIDERKLAGRKTPPQQRTTADDETNPTAEENGFDRNVDAAVLTADRKTGTVYVVLDDSFTRGIKIEVTEGDDVISLKNKIKKEASPIFDSVPMVGVVLFKSEGTTVMEAESTSDTVEIPLNPVGQALNVFEEWNLGVTWGTKNKPLIVVYSPPAITMTNHNGECSVFVCECAFVDEIFLNCYVMRNASLYIYCKFVVFSCDF